MDGADIILRYKHDITSEFIIKKIGMASIQTEELVCPRPPCFKYFSPLFRPLKFLGPALRKEEEFVSHMDANASFK